MPAVRVPFAPLRGLIMHVFGPARGQKRPGAGFMLQVRINRASGGMCLRNTTDKTSISDVLHSVDFRMVIGDLCASAAQEYANSSRRLRLIEQQTLSVSRNSRRVQQGLRNQRRGNQMRVLIAAALAVTLSATSLLAGTTAPLAPGKPAGVQSAQLMDNGLYYIIGIGVLGGVSSWLRPAMAR